MPWFEREWVSAVEWAGLGRVLAVLSAVPLLIYFLVLAWSVLVNPLAERPPATPFVLATLALAAAGFGLWVWGARKARRARPPGGERLRTPE